ncbi:carbohydrate ABC transporter permease [Ktedonobacter racemifer]|uniref:Binding-protein-dependent transport systems inner membrane component n=1 Tax=Ktedonobacter racemifer DSM 44963 TaxID=485913 RepID=D6U1P3_KTERA|nr:carbohydrate ABC transporter permease [Ktedonobacter racemifer]EFH82687.1 binding-protein-dependent transport systems inner membrane component [Ktedonobacter racemifer DSM 44963]
MRASLQLSDTSHAKRAPFLLRRAVPRLINHIVLFLFSLIIVYPIIWTVIASFKTQSDLLSNIWGLPRSLAWQNYTNAWQTAELGYALFNSFLVAVLTTLLVAVLSALAGYALSTFRFRFAAAILLIFVLTMQAPVPIIPLYVLLVQLNLTDSYLGLIIPLAAAGLPISIFIFWGYFQSIPHELRDAAVVDGCSELNAFVRIVLPISGPAIASVCILEFLAAWNEYFLPLIIIRTPEMRTLPLAIQVFFYAYRTTDLGQVFAALMVGALPTIIIYLFLQRLFIRGLTSGVVKG